MPAKAPALGVESRIEAALLDRLQGSEPSARRVQAAAEGGAIEEGRAACGGASWKPTSRERWLHAGRRGPSSISPASAGGEPGRAMALILASTFPLDAVSECRRGQPHEVNLDPASPEAPRTQVLADCFAHGGEPYGAGPAEIGQLVCDILRGDHPTLRYPLGQAGGRPLRSGLPAGSRSRGMWRKAGAAASATRACGG